MRICFLDLSLGDEFSSLQERLRHHSIHRGLGKALADRGHEVHVILGSRRASTLHKEFGTVHGIRPGPISRGAGFLTSIVRPTTKATATPLSGAIRRLQTIDADLVHLHGAVLHLNHGLLTLSRLLESDPPPLVVQYHGGFPSNHSLLRWIQRINLRGADGFLVTTPDQAHPFQDATLLSPGCSVYTVMEGSSDFNRIHEKRARERTGMRGDPICLCAARLDPVKDPRTVLEGFARSIPRLPDPQLYFYYLDGPLEDELRAIVRSDSKLRTRIHFRGRAPYEQMEWIHSSADVLLQASRREFSSWAVLETMSCGTVPIVTDLPSFRKMTGEGRFGRLFEPGSPSELSDRLCEIAHAPLAALKNRVRRFFQSEFSYPQLGVRLEEIYEDVLSSSRPSPRRSVRSACQTDE